MELKFDNDVFRKMASKQSLCNYLLYSVLIKSELMERTQVQSNFSTSRH